jgi:glycosyltransferase involved in cell wall biosynthesis
MTHAELEAIYNSADHFVLGSHSESEGYSLLKAMPCGTVPVMTGIPSFRQIVGASGEVWTPGDRPRVPPRSGAFRRVPARSGARWLGHCRTRPRQLRLVSSGD